MTAVFEKFTERAIKAVMLAQQEAKALSRPEVGPEHILMGLVAEEAKKGGYLGSGMTIERRARRRSDITSFDAARAQRANSEARPRFPSAAARNACSRRRCRSRKTSA